MLREESSLNAANLSGGSAEFWRDLRTLPNLLSVSRIVMILAAIALLYAGWPYLALAVGFTGGLTDYLDGYLARKTGRVTELGALLDTSADVLMSLVSLGAAVDLGVWPYYLLVVWGVRDTLVLSLRASAAQQGFVLRSVFLGKLGTNVMFYSFVIMIFDYARPFGEESAWTGRIHWFGLGAIHAGLFFFWWAAVRYLGSYVRQYRGSRVLGKEIRERAEEGVDRRESDLSDRRDLEDPARERALAAVDHEASLAHPSPERLEIQPVRKNHGSQRS